jgi:anti-anti-sigma factor
MSPESPVVFSDRVEMLIPVETTASDEWRATVELRGEFDVANAAVISDALTRHLDEGRRVIRVDARAVGFMDSTAMARIAQASERCRAVHGSLILTGVPRQLQRLITIAGLDEVLLVDTASPSDVAADALSMTF